MRDTIYERLDMVTGAVCDDNGETRGIRAAYLPVYHNDTGEAIRSRCSSGNVERTGETCVGTGVSTHDRAPFPAKLSLEQSTDHNHDEV